MTTEIMFRKLGTDDRLVDRVIEEIEQLIVNGTLALNTKLPPERALAEELNVSRTVLREALQTLIAKGLIETRPGVGNIVRQVTRDQVVEPLSLYLKTQGRAVTFEDLHQVRSILEVEVAGLAAAQATKQDLESLRQIMREMQLAETDPAVFAEKDAAFHQALVETTHNPLLILLLGSVRDLLREYLAIVIPRLDTHLQIMPYHQRILERVTEGDVDGARKAMQAHLVQIRKNHEQAFGSFDGSRKNSRTTTSRAKRRVPA